MAKTETLNDVAWQKICHATGLLTEIKKSGYYMVTADELKLHGEREPRLMAKIDSLAERPELFRKEDLGILPTGRGSYVVFRDSTKSSFIEIKSSDDEQATSYFHSFEWSNLDTINKGLLTSESEAIDVAYLSCLLASFVGTENLVLTKRGRFGSNRFDLQLPGINALLKVEGAQLEVDSVFESEDLVVLVEAKIGLRDNFHIRQLFYPWKWLSTMTEKQIIPVLLCYSNGEFRLTEFELSDTWGNIKIKKQELFVLDELAVTDMRLSHLLRYSGVLYEDMSIPFPQADDMAKVIDIVTAVSDGVFADSELINEFGFVQRQAHYYLAAASYLGFIFKQRDQGLTDTGYRLVKEKSRMNRTEIILKQMLARQVFRESIELLRSRDFNLANIEQNELMEILARVRTDITGDTISRRATTVRRWLKWVLLNTNLIS